MSTSDTQTTLQPVEDDASADTSADHAAAAPMSRADIDNALRGLTRDDLFTALTRAKEEMDRLDGVVSTQTLQIESLLANNHDLTARLQHSDDDVQKAQLLIQQREARVDELVYDQEKMEDEYYKKLATLERLKTRADESDRRLAEAERKANELVRGEEGRRRQHLALHLGTDCSSSFLPVRGIDFPSLFSPTLSRKQVKRSANTTRIKRPCSAPKTLVSQRTMPISRTR